MTLTASHAGSDCTTYHFLMGKCNVSLDIYLTMLFTIALFWKSSTVWKYQNTGGQVKIGQYIKIKIYFEIIDQNEMVLIDHMAIYNRFSILFIYEFVRVSCRWMVYWTFWRLMLCKGARWDFIVDKYKKGKSLEVYHSQRFWVLKIQIFNYSYFFLQQKL